MIMIYWLPARMLQTLCMLPMVSMAGMLSNPPRFAPAGSLQADLE